MSVLAPPPYATPLVEAPLWTITSQWGKRIQDLFARIEETPPVLANIPLVAQAASIGTTSIPIGAQAAGLFLVLWYLRITTVAGVSSSATVTIGNTDGGVSCTQSGSAVTGNTTSTIQSGAVLVRCDPAIAPTYQVTYASNPASAMQYRLDLVLQGMG